MFNKSVGKIFYDENGHFEEWHSAEDHCLDVAYSAYFLLNQNIFRSRLENLFDFSLTKEVIHVICVIVGIHDIGKSLNGFQAKIRRDENICQKFNKKTSGHFREIMSILFANNDYSSNLEINDLMIFLEGVFSSLLKNYDKENLEDFFGSIFFHHGRPFNRKDYIDNCIFLNDLQLKNNLIENYSPVKNIKDIFSLLIKHFNLFFKADFYFPDTAKFRHALSGLIMLSDQLGSYKKVFNYTNGINRKKSEYNFLLKKMSEVLGSFNLQNEFNYKMIFGDKDLRPLQKVLLESSIDERIYTLEADTGSGKTEASIILFERLLYSGLVDGMTFLVPTRSAASELYNRIENIITNLHPEVKGKVVRGIPGNQTVDPSISIFDEDWNKRPWVIGGSHKLFCAPVSVGTIDQALMSTLRMKQAWLRDISLKRLFIVIDEVHYGDPYMHSLVEKLIKRHVDSGGYVLIMSATLDENLKSKFLNRKILTPEDAISKEYPILETKNWKMNFPSVFNREIELKVSSKENCINKILECYDKGGKVLVIKSTISDAFNFKKELLKVRSDLDIIFHHSRFYFNDRKFLDNKLMENMGNNTKGKNVICIATQTAEQSLDIDADFLVTDVCPVDVFIQRLGRLYRSGKFDNRPFGKTPKCFVLDPGNLSDYIISNKERPILGKEDQGWSYVYSNLFSIKEMLNQSLKGFIKLPEMSRVLLENGTHPDLICDNFGNSGEKMDEKWKLLKNYLFSIERNQINISNLNQIDFNKNYCMNSIDEFSESLTRLGLLPYEFNVVGLKSPFLNENVTSLNIPRSWIKDTSFIKDDFCLIFENNKCVLGDQVLSYNVDGLMKEKI